MTAAQKPQSPIDLLTTNSPPGDPTSLDQEGVRKAMTIAAMCIAAEGKGFKPPAPGKPGPGGGGMIGTGQMSIFAPGQMNWGGQFRGPGQKVVKVGQKAAAARAAATKAAAANTNAKAPSKAAPKKAASTATNKKQTGPAPQSELTQTLEQKMTHVSVGLDDAKKVDMRNPAKPDEVMSIAEKARYLNSWASWLGRGVFTFVKEKAHYVAMNPAAGVASLVAYKIFANNRPAFFHDWTSGGFDSANNLSHDTITGLLHPIVGHFGISVVDPLSPLIGLIVAIIMGIVAIATILFVSMVIKQAAFYGTKLALRFIGSGVRSLKDKTVAWWTGQAKESYEDSMQKAGKSAQETEKKVKSLAEKWADLKTSLSGSDWEQLTGVPSPTLPEVEAAATRVANHAGYAVGVDASNPKKLTEEEQKRQEAEAKTGKMAGGLLVGLLTASVVGHVGNAAEKAVTNAAKEAWESTAGSLHGYAQGYFADTVQQAQEEAASETSQSWFSQWNPFGKPSQMTRQQIARQRMTHPRPAQRVARPQGHGAARPRQRPVSHPARRGPARQLPAQRRPARPRGHEAARPRQRPARQHPAKHPAQQRAARLARERRERASIVKYVTG